MFNILLFSGQPVLVEISVSLRNILEIDEHRQVNIYFFEIMYIPTRIIFDRYSIAILAIESLQNPLHNKMQLEFETKKIRLKFIN